MADGRPTLRHPAGEDELEPWDVVFFSPGPNGAHRPRVKSRRTKIAEKPTLFVCHGDDGGPRMHPCRRVQEALRTAGIEYDKVIAGHGSPIPFLRKDSRDELRAETGATKLPALKLPEGTVITHSRAILSWVDQRA